MLGNIFKFFTIMVSLTFKILKTWFLYLQIGKQKQFWKKGDKWIKNPTSYDTKSVVEANCLRLI